MEEAVKLRLPVFTSLRRTINKALKIDRLDIMYEPMCAINSEGMVTVCVKDERIQDPSAQTQCMFVFPVRCRIKCTYFGSSWVSTTVDKLPWSCTYRLTETNISTGVNYCMITGYLKFAKSSNLGDTTLRAPMVEILNSNYTINDVNVWHVGEARTDAKLLRTMSIPRVDYRRPNVLTGVIGSDAHSVLLLEADEDEIKHRRSTSSYDIGPSASQTGVDPARASVSVPIQDLIAGIVSALQDRERDRANVTEKPNINIR